MLHLLLVHVSFANSSKNPTRLNFPVIAATRSVKRVVFKRLQSGYLRPHMRDVIIEQGVDGGTRLMRVVLIALVVRESQPVTGPYRSDG